MIDQTTYAHINRQMIIELQKDLQEVKKDVYDIKCLYVNRLPIWATVIISLLTASLGATLGIILK